MHNKRGIFLGLSQIGTIHPTLLGSYELQVSLLVTELFRPLTLWVMEDKSLEKLTPTEEFFVPLVEALYTGNIWEKIGMVVAYILVGIFALAMAIGLGVIFLLAIGLGAWAGLDFLLLFG